MMDIRLLFVLLLTLPTFCHALGEAALEVWPLFLFVIICGMCLCCLVYVSEKYDWKQQSNKRTRKQMVKDHKKETITNRHGTVREATDTDVIRQENEVPLGNWYEYDEAALVTDEYRARHKSVLHKA